MSTFIDGAPPSVTPDPEDDGPGTGGSWLQEEIRRRMAERSSGPGSGGRHARRDPAGEPPVGVGHVPRHSVATPGPGAPSPGPIGGPSLPSGAPAGRRRQREPDAGWSGPDPDAPPRPGRRIPQAFRPGARGVPTNAPATFGGPGFTAPANRHTPAAPTEPERSRPERAQFGGPDFAGPATRDELDPLDRDSAAAPAGLPTTDDRPAATGPHPARPVSVVPARPAPRGDHRPADAEVLPPRAAARLLAAPGGVQPPGSPHPVEPVRRPPADPAAPGPGAYTAFPQGDPDLTGPLPPVDRRGLPVQDDGDDGFPGPDDEDTVLWSAHVPLADDGTGTASPALPMDVPEPRAAESGPARRVKVTFSERRSQAHPVRTVVDIQEGGAVGELLRSNLIGSQLTVALRFALLAGLTIGLLPLAFALFPEIGRVDILGLRLPWLLLGVVVYPFLLGLGWWHTRTAERVEQNFADHVQD